MATTRFFLDLRGKAKDGKGSIIIILYHNFTTSTISTGIRVSPDNWQNQSVVKLVGAEAINANLQDKKLKIDRAIALLSVEDGFDFMTASELKSKIDTIKPQRERGHLVSTLFNEYMGSGSLKEGTKEIYRAALKKVLTFGGEKVKIESVNIKWIRDFEQFLSKTQGINGRAIYLRHLRAICKYAEQNDIIQVNPFNKFHIKHEETRKRCVPLTNLQKFYLYPTTKANEVYRDFFFLMFYLIGINAVDLFTAKKSQIVNGRLEYTRAKTGKKYSIRIEPEAQALLDKYAGKEDNLVNVLDHCKHYKNFLHELNKALKSIGPAIGKEFCFNEDLFAKQNEKDKVDSIIPDVSTQFARHTWATLAHEAGIPSDIIAMSLGHSPVNKTTFIYIKPDRNKVDEANRKVIDLFIRSVQQE